MTSSAVDAFSALYTYISGLTIRAFDAAGDMLEIVASSLTSILAGLGDASGAANGFLQWAFDDISAAVQWVGFDAVNLTNMGESAWLTIMGLGLVGMILMRSRHGKM
jgi:hypothetical protein